MSEPSQRVAPGQREADREGVAEKVLMRHQPDRTRPAPPVPDPAGTRAAAAVLARAVHGEQQPPAVGQPGQFATGQWKMRGEIGVVLGDPFQGGQPVQDRLP